MPGTTANSAERTANTFSNVLFNASPYAGGATQGKYGAVGFILDYDCGEHVTFKNVAASASIYAKKSYFFFDNEIVCVGNDISDKSGTEVKAVIENRYWRPAGETITLIGDNVNAITTPETVETTLDERALHFTNMGGYVIFKDFNASLVYKKASNSYNGTTGYTEAELPQNLKTNREFFELYLNHGEGDKNGTLQSNRYYYAYLPEATVEQTAEYSKNPDVELLNINKAHTVLEKKLGIVASNFFENVKVNVPAEFSQYTNVKSISAQTICSVMVEKGDDGAYIISVADPTRLLDGINFTVNISGITQVVSADNGVSASVSDNTVTVKVNCKDSLGQTFTLTVK
jgi:hyaluronate lyase